MLDEDRISLIVKRVLENLESDSPPNESRFSNAKASLTSDRGIFTDLDAAMYACHTAQKAFEKMSLKKRKEIIQSIRDECVKNAQRLAEMAVECTDYGRVDDKTQKNINAAVLTPGVEDIPSKIMTGDNGATFIERVPMGLIVALTPATHPAALIINNAIAMLSGGNSVFVCPHPAAQIASRETIKVINDAIVKSGGPENLVVALDRVDLKLVDAACRHKYCDMISATGGPAVEEMALKCGKKAIVGGPGNPPVLVDETADIKRAAKAIIDGGTFDNNVLCIAEKEIIAVSSIADELLYELSKNKCYMLDSKEAKYVTELVVIDGKVNKKYIGKDASLILNDAGIHVTEDYRAAIMDVPFEHPLVGIEQMLPVFPLVRAMDFEEALKYAKEAEHGFGHTAMIHSKDIERITRYGREMNVIIMVANAPSGAGLNVKGEGHYTHSISDTGEGVCTPVDFTKERRFIIGNFLRFV